MVTDLSESHNFYYIKTFLMSDEDIVIEKKKTSPSKNANSLKL